MSATTSGRTLSVTSLGRTPLVLGVSLALVVAVAAGWWYTSGKESTDDAQVDGHIVPVAPRAGGTVMEVRVQINQRVEKGALLVQIDPRDYQIALERARADLADAEAASEAARNGVPITSATTAGQVASATASVERARIATAIAEKDIEGAKARLVGAQARLKEAKANETRVANDLDRMKQLVAKDEVSRQQYDATVAASEAAKAAVEGAQAGVVEAEQGVQNALSRREQSLEAARQAEADLRTAHTAPAQMNVSRARLGSADARLQMVRASVAQAQLNLEHTSVVAPAAGIVSRKSVEPGQVVQPGQPLLALVQVDEVWVTANFKETQLKDMRVGQPAQVSVDAYGRSYSGIVESLAGATGARFSLLPPENATGNFVKVVQRVPVRIVFDKNQGVEQLLRPGMSVTATVRTR